MTCKVIRGCRGTDVKDRFSWANEIQVCALIEMTKSYAHYDSYQFDHKINVLTVTRDFHFTQVNRKQVDKAVNVFQCGG